MQRRRARAAFYSELPIKVGRPSISSESLERVMRPLAELAELDFEQAEQLISEVVKSYQGSREMEAQRLSRPDIGETLKQVRGSALRAGALLDQLGEEAKDLTLRLKENGEEWLHMAVLAEAMAELAEDLSIPTDSPPGMHAAPVISSLITSLEELALRLANLPHVAEWELIVLQEEEPLSDHAKDGHLILAGLLTWLTGACEIARALLQKRGTKSDSVQMRAVGGLAAAYERLLQSAPTFSVRDRRVYTGVPQTPFGRMVEVFFNEYEPDPAKRRGHQSACMWAIRQRNRAANATI